MMRIAAHRNDVADGYAIQEEIVSRYVRYNPRALRRRHAGDVAAIKRYRTVIRYTHARDGAEQRGFSGAVSSKDRDYFAGLDLESGAIDE
jgi:hypothetical protein